MKKQKNVSHRTAPPVTPGHHYENAVKCILECAPLSQKQRDGIVRLQEQQSLSPVVKLVSATALLVAGPELAETELNRVTVSHIAGQWLYRSMNGHQRNKEGAL